MSKNYIIGLDLGINNVGYSIIDDENSKIIKTGVRLYRQANGAQDRRISRNTRRRMKRKNNRVSECLKLFNSIGFPNTKTIDVSLLQKRKKGLTDKLEKQEIVNIVCYFMSHRGYIPFGDETSKIDLNGEYPCEYYLRLYNDIGKYRALDQMVENKDLKRELETILIQQSNFYPELKEIIGNDDNGLIWIFIRKRKFWEGPGSINSFTPFGRFKNKDDVEEYSRMQENGKEKYLFEELVGRCNIYPHEKCAPKANYYAEKFNLLNDFINIRIANIDSIKRQEYLKQEDKNDYKLSTEALNDIITYCLQAKGTLTYKKVLKDVLELTKEDIRNYRIDKKNKPTFSLMNVYRYIIKMYETNNLDVTWLINDDYKNYNILMNLFAVSPGIVEVEKMISNIHECSKEELNVLKEIRNKLKKDGMLQYHALSEKALIRATNDMITCGLNFMQVSRKFDYEKEAREALVKGYGTGNGFLLMTTKYVDDIVASPQVKKTLRQAINVVNAIIKEQGYYPTVIAVESTKDMNSSERKKEIEQNQKVQEKLRKDALKYLEHNIGKDNITDTLVEKTKLYLEMNGECPYCGHNININDVINNIIQVEHIIPISKSGDDSQDNKTLSCSNCNKQKNNRTPYEFLGEVEFDRMTERINEFKISEKKRSNFLTTEDVNKYQARFFHRNLRDTAYATKEMIRQIQLFNLYIKEYLNDTEIFTLSTPGQLTHKIREQWKLEKDRNDGNYHHAVDASIVGGIATTKIGKEIVRLQNDSQYLVLNKSKLEEIPDLLTKFSLPKMKEEISSITSDNDIYISMQIDTDPNQSISNANIYSYIKKNDQYYKIEQIDDIYSPDLIKKDKKKLDSLFDENDKKYTLLCQEKDPQLFNYLKDIYNKYQNNDTNPFLNYCRELMNDNTQDFNFYKHGIKTPSKNNKGVLIKKLRYMSNCTDPFLLNKKNINKKENTLIGLDSVSNYCVRLYWDLDEEKIIFIPIYTPCVNFKTGKINEQHSLYQFYYNKFIKDKNVEFIVDLFNGNYVEIEKSDGTIICEYIKGYSKASKSIQCKSGKYLSPKDKFTLYDVDVLGNKYKRLTWPKE